MALIDDITAICRRLANKGWAELLNRHGLKLDEPELASELARELPAIDRAQPGFEDFTSAGKRAIEPGKPAACLLYHALASPNVHPTLNGEPGLPDAYPTLT